MGRGISSDLVLCKTPRPIQYSAKLFIKPDITTNMFHDLFQDTVHAQAFHFGSSPIHSVSALLLTPPRKMDEDVGSVEDVAYIGYSIHFDAQADRKLALKVIEDNADVRANRITMIDFSDFVFLNQNGP